MRAIATTAAAVLAAFVAGGCGGDRASDAPIRDAGDLEDVCHGTYFTRAPAPGAGPPRPIAVFEEEQGNRLTRQLMLRVPKAFQAVDGGRYQLVACAKRTDEGAKIKDCAFDSGVTSAPLHAGTYEVTVYEARTRKVRKTVSIRARDETCPAARFFPDENDLRMFATPTPEQYVTALRDLVGTDTTVAAPAPAPEQYVTALRDLVATS